MWAFIGELKPPPLTSRGFDPLTAHHFSTGVFRSDPGKGFLSSVEGPLKLKGLDDPEDFREFLTRFPTKSYQIIACEKGWGNKRLIGKLITLGNQKRVVVEHAMTA